MDSLLIREKILSILSKMDKMPVTDDTQEIYTMLDNLQLDIADDLYTITQLYLDEAEKNR